MNWIHGLSFFITSMSGLFFQTDSNPDIAILQGAPSSTDYSRIASYGFQNGGGLAVEYKNFGLRLSGHWMGSTGREESQVLIGTTTAYRTSTRWSGGVLDVDLYYAFLHWSGLSFYGGLGPELLWASLESHYRDVATYATEVMEGRGHAVGGKFFVGVHRYVTDSVRLSAEVGYRYATVSEFEAQEIFWSSSANRINRGSTLKHASGATFTGSNVALKLSAPYVALGFSARF